MVLYMGHLIDKEETEIFFNLKSFRF